MRGEKQNYVAHKILMYFKKEEKKKKQKMNSHAFVFSYTLIIPVGSPRNSSR